jgi:hypothetical protein
VQAQKFKLLRYNDELPSLQQDSTEKSAYEKFKLKRWSETRYASFGGEIRYMAQNFVNEDWGDFPVREYTALYSRFLFHANVHLSNAVRGFVQFNSTFANGRVTPVRLIDENRFSVHQAFLDVRVAKPLLLRAGRQELLYGSQRLISVREGPNNRLSFDAVKMIFHRPEFTADFFYARPVGIKPGVVDDVINENQLLWGGYAVIHHVPFLENADLYYLGIQRKQAQFDDGVADEVRHSFGTRWWGKRGSWDYDMEAVYQLGSFATGIIQAWTTSINTNYKFPKLKTPLTVGLKTEIISGDRARNDGTINTFNPLFPRGAYFGLAALIGPSNLVDVHPSAKIELSPGFTLSLDYDAFWRHSLADGIYGPNGALIYSGENTTARFIGHQVGINGELSINEHFTITPEFTWFGADAFLKQAGRGEDVYFSALTLQYKY